MSHDMPHPASGARRRTGILLCLCLCAALLGVGYASAQAPRPETVFPRDVPTATPTIPPFCLSRRFEISTAHTTVGQFAELVIRDSLPYGGGVDLTFDPALVQVVDAAGNPATTVTVPHEHDPMVEVWANSVDNVAGTISVSALRPGMAGVYEIARIRFKGLAPGTAMVRPVGGLAHNPGAPCYYGEFWIGTGVVYVSAYPSATPTASSTPNPTDTPTPSRTPTATNTPGSRMVHGVVQDEDGHPVAGAGLELARDVGGWSVKAQGTSGADGIFRMWTNPVTGKYRLQVAYPLDYQALAAAAPQGITLAPESDAATLFFALDDAPGPIGPFDFVATQVITATLTPAPQPTLPVLISGFVWLDGSSGEPLDGARQDGEGLAGCRVTLDSGALATLAETLTDVRGYFAFGAAPGSYTLALHDPLGRVPDAQHQAQVGDSFDEPVDWAWHQVRLPILWRQIKPDQPLAE